MRLSFHSDGLHLSIQITLTWPRWLARIVHRPRERIAGLHRGNYTVADDFDDSLPEDFLITGT